MSKTERRLLMRQRYNRSVDLLLHLRAFCEVVDQRSFTRAAAELGVPQPVVSRRVAALEKHLGGRLLVRDPRGVTPTDRGRAVLPHARDLGVRAEHLVTLGRAVGTGLTLAVPAGASARALVPVRDAARDAGLEVDLVVADPDERAAAAGRAAGGLALVPCAPDEADLVGPLGAATRAEASGRLHLDTLRAGRGRTGRARRVHLGPEDDRPWVRDVVRRAVARSGLSPAQLVVGSPTLTAVTDVLAHDDLWVATPLEAAAHDLAWRPVADLEVRRAYRLAVGRGGAAAAGPAVRRRLLDALGPALGLDVAEPR
ncbi:LysR family transcriptional regulator [Nocardioides sp. CFH 31398]|uniref:LysR family transcriptional regulator n=1 Tax=Nocardioides sp. CFH 31398 TaxID=2919579 RepID=UPI001F055F88|nr:LysR family transcriptional regulator [Nocardioides sp. CFH 31398]MCH1867986.1 LysR family transcriptional regulator [Nocardioides sp. CFH 31398]